MLKSGRENRLYVKESISASESSQAAGNFDFHFYHTKILLSLIIGKRHEEIIREPQDFGLVINKPIDQSADFAFFSFPSFWIYWRERVLKNCPIKNLVIFRFLVIYVMLSGFYINVFLIKIG